MTSKTKDQIKAFFQTGDKPSESQFIDLIDSYVDKSGPIGDMETLASAGNQGFTFVSAYRGELKSASQARTALEITVYTTADVSVIAVAAVAGNYVTTAAASAAAAVAISSAYATTAIAVSGLATTGIMNPVTTRNLVDSRIGASFTSSPQTMTAGSSVSIAHGLGAVPSTIDLYAVCISAEDNYAVGDKIRMQAWSESGVSRGAMIAADATNIYIIVAAGTVNYLDRSTGAFAGMDLTKWQFVGVAKA